jgi:transposase
VICDILRRGGGFMYIRVTKSPTSKFSKVYLVEGYRDENGKAKQRTIKCYGNLEELQEQDPDILDKLRLEAKGIELNNVTVELNLKQKNGTNGPDLNYGYFFLESLYEHLKLPDFFRKSGARWKKEYDLNEIVKLLVFSRILDPASKLATLENQANFFQPFQVEKNSVYRSLSALDEINENLQYFLHKEVSASYSRDCSLVFYDVTNYYFEIDEEDDLKQLGMCKEKRKSPIVQMGLFIDSNGLPICYKLFPGSTADTSTLIPIVQEMKHRYDMGRVILTADKGLNSGKNLAFLVKRNDGYIVSQKVRGTSRAFIKQVLDEKDYEYNKSGTFKVKSFLRDRIVKDENGEEVELHEKVVCFWSKDYDDREKRKREELEEKLCSILENPSKYNASNRFGLKKYVKLKHVNSETGEIEKIKPRLEFDQEKYDRDRELDGYYVLISSEINLSESEIIEKYRGLWKIEESFKVIKSDLEGRPVHVRRNDRVKGHFLICYLALLLSRIIELKLEHRHSVRRIQKALKDATCRVIDKGLYSLAMQDEVFKDIESIFKVSIDQDYARIEQLRTYRKEAMKVHNKK